MKVYKTQEEVERDVVGGVLKVEDDVTFECDISLPHVDIIARKIIARNINAWNINACDIKACDIKAWYINAWDIEARDIKVWDIKACDIKACDIKVCYINARDINACDIKATEIEYYAFCNVSENIRCESIKGTRENHAQPICLDGKLYITK